MRNKQYFEEVAIRWDQMQQSFFSDHVRELAISIANPQIGESVVDVGAGTGFITEGLINRGLKVIAVDQSQAMIREMKNKFREYATIDYRIGESENLPIKDETADCVFANMYLHHVESPSKSIKEMVRILKTGGKVVITDLEKHNYQFLKSEQHDRWLGFERKNIKRWFVEAGLKNITVDCTGENCCADSNNKPEKAMIGIFVASGEK